MQELHSAILDCYKPRLIPLGANLTAAVFPFMKIFPAEFCLRRARDEGWVKSQTIVVETSSGNMALGLAIICNLYRYRLTIVTDYACKGFMQQRLEDLGAHVEIVSAPAATGGYQQARLDKLTAICSETPDHWWVNQYDNPGNPGAYGFLAAQLVDAIGQIDCLIGTVGSGGSVCGTASFLHELFPEMITLGVDTFGSVLFGQQDRTRMLRGLGNSIVPKNLDHSIFNEVHWVNAAEAYSATRQLHRSTSLFCGATSGAAWMVADYWARKNPKARVVCIFPDDGYRYTDTVYNDGYLFKENLWLPDLPKEPVRVEHPLEAGPGWSSMMWGRCAYSEIVSPSTQTATSVS